MQQKEDVWTFGEVVVPADVQKSYANSLNGTLDFLLCQALRLTFAQHSWRLSEFAAFLNAHFQYFPDDFSQPAFIDNHDMNRFLFSVNNDQRLLRLVLTILYTLSGPPIVYYGTENGLSQNRSIHEKGAKGFDEARLAMIWEDEPRPILSDLLKKMADFRGKTPETYTKEWKILWSDDEEDALVLGKADNSLILIINRSEEFKEIQLSLDQKMAFQDPIDEETFDARNGLLEVYLKPVSAQILVRE